MVFPVIIESILTREGQHLQTGPRAKKGGASKFQKQKGPLCPARYI